MRASNAIGDHNVAGDKPYDYRINTPYVSPPFNINPYVELAEYLRGGHAHTDDSSKSVFDPCPAWHSVNEYTQYPDGVFGNCSQCGARVRLKRVPGGYVAQEIKDLLERVAAGETEADGELLAELARLKLVLESEIDEIELAVKRLEISETVLKERGLV